MTPGDLEAALSRLRALVDREEDDEELVRRLADGSDPTALERLMWRHGRMVLGLCRRVVRDAHGAEDAFQATFLILLRKAGTIGKGRSVASWLYQVAYRISLRARAGAARAPAAADDRIRSVSRDDPTPTGDLWQVLDEEINRLPEKYRSAVVLCDLEGLSRDEAARALGCPGGTVASRLARGREQLRARLERRGITHAGAAVAGPAVEVDRLIFALLRVAGGAAPSPSVRVLTQGVLRSMFWKKVGPVLALILAGVLALGGSALARRGPDEAAEKGEKAEKKDEGKKEADDKAGTWKLAKTYPAEKLGKPTALALSADGQTLAVATADNSVGLWDVGGEKEKVRVVTKLPQTVRALAFSPDGKRVAVGAGEVVRVYEKGKLLKAYEQPEKLPRQAERKVRAVTFSPDGKAVAALVCDELTEKAAMAAKGDLPAHAVFWRLGGEMSHVAVMGNVKSMAFSADSKSLIAGGAAYAILKGRGGASLATRAVIGKTNIRPLPDNDEDHLALAVSPDDKTLATAGSDHHVRLYDPNGKLLATLKGHASAVRVVTFSDRGDLLATGDDSKIILWDVKSRERKATLANKGALAILRFTKGGKLLSVDQQGVVKAWEKK
jgi:RNA polymerase sigma factor (sigma-70 family)